MKTRQDEILEEAANLRIPTIDPVTDRVVVFNVGKKAVRPKSWRHKKRVARRRANLARKRNRGKR